MAEQLTFTGDPTEWADRGLDWIQTHLFSRVGLTQAIIAAGVLLLVWMLCRAMGLGRRRNEAAQPAAGWRADPLIAPLLRELKRSAWAGISGLVLLFADAIARHNHLPHQVLTIVTAGALAWVVAHLAGALIKSRFLGMVAAWVIWVLAVLHALGLSATAIEFLDDLGVAVGGTRLSLLLLIKGLVLLFVLLQAARLASGVLDERLDRADGISPSARVLFAKGARFVFYALAVTITLSSVGVDLTSLTVFSGAVGVGIGFGLQKVFSNLVSGVILLLDKSLKPGDVIEVSGVQGKIAQINARYAAVETLDGKAYLIPNENLIGNEVINLSYSNSRLLLRADVGVAYASDLREAMRLMAEAAASVPRVLKDPEPRTLITEFADSSVNLSVGFWIEDPHNGTGNVKSDVLLAIWDAFKTGGVEIPFPQREVRLLGQ
jgi:small-conductance mechanosensitive channel